MPPREGAEPEPFGAANTHADFPCDFLELATVVPADGRVPTDARLVPLQAPPDVLPKLLERINATSANLAECLERFEGLHILMFSSSDIDATAARSTADGVRALVVCTVAVRDLAATKTLLQDNKVPLQQAPLGDLFVPATAALGVTIAFRQADQPATTG